MDYRVLTEAERKYTFSQSQQLSMQTGLIGYLRADFGSTGNEFWTTWNDFRKDLKTDEFKAEFDDVINELRNGDVLADRKAMSSYCYSTPDSSFNDELNHHGIRLDEQLIRRINTMLKKTFGLWIYKKEKEENIRCLCPKCLSEYINNPNYIVRRLDPFAKEKDRCDKCDKAGWDYVVTERSSVRKGKSGSYEK